MFETILLLTVCAGVPAGVPPGGAPTPRKILTMTANGWTQIAFSSWPSWPLPNPWACSSPEFSSAKKLSLIRRYAPSNAWSIACAALTSPTRCAGRNTASPCCCSAASPWFGFYLLERAQSWLAFNPQKLPNVAPDLAWNTAASFTTNTNWQSYVPETTMSYLTQMAGLAYHNFASAAVGIALAIALIRGISRREKEPSAISGWT